MVNPEQVDISIATLSPNTKYQFKNVRRCSMKNSLPLSHTHATSLRSRDVNFHVVDFATLPTCNFGDRSGMALSRRVQNTLIAITETISRTKGEARRSGVLFEPRRKEVSSLKETACFRGSWLASRASNSPDIDPETRRNRPGLVSFFRLLLLHVGPAVAPTPLYVCLSYLLW